MMSDFEWTMPPGERLLRTLGMDVPPTTILAPGASYSDMKAHEKMKGEIKKLKEEVELLKKGNITSKQELGFHSEYRICNEVVIPDSENIDVYMMAFSVELALTVGKRFLKPELFIWEPLVKSMLSNIERRNITAYLTIDKRIVKEGESHRRGGAHIDGAYQRKKESEKKVERKDYWIIPPPRWPVPAGEMLVVSDHPGCMAWGGDFIGELRSDGGCEHLKSQLDKIPSEILKPNYCYHLNATCVHESIRQDRDVTRTLVRITL